MRKITLFLIIITILFEIFQTESYGEEIIMTVEQSIELAEKLVSIGEFKTASDILTKIPKMNKKLEIERWFLLALISQKQGNFKTAIEIYKKILDMEPNLARVRFELALCYMNQKSWSRADYHLRLAMADDNLPNNVRRLMKYYRYVIKQNKNWNIWFNVGASPDNNINNSKGGDECVITTFGLMCRDLDEPESAVGVNAIFGGNYEFKLSNQWKWKSDLNIYSNIYNKHKYDDFYLMTSTGPRYIGKNGDIWVAGILARRWYGWDPYNLSKGIHIDTNYDLTNKVSSGLYFRFMKNKYDDYDDILSGKTYSLNTRLTYSLNASIYTIMRTGITRESAVNGVYSYWQPSLAVGIGAELPWGFHIYGESNIYWTNYDDSHWVVANNLFTKVKERDFTYRYLLSVSSNKLDIFGFIPTVTTAYTRRNSNIWQREYDKTSLEFTMEQKF